MRVPPTRAEEQSPAHSNTGTRVARGMRVPLAESRAPLLFPINPGTNWKSENPAWNRRDGGVRVAAIPVRGVCRWLAPDARGQPDPNPTATPISVAATDSSVSGNASGGKENTPPGEAGCRGECCLDLGRRTWWGMGRKAGECLPGGRFRGDGTDHLGVTSSSRGDGRHLGEGSAGRGGGVVSARHRDERTQSSGRAKAEKCSRPRPDAATSPVIPRGFGGSGAIRIAGPTAGPCKTCNRYPLPTR